MKIQSKIGNEALMQRRKTAFVCSRKTPDGLEYLVGKWLLGLSPERDCVMCGNQSPMERAVFSVLIERKIPTVLVLAEAMPSCFADNVETALREGRLLAITHCDGSVHSVTARSAFDRNVLMLSLAQDIVVGCCTKGGRLERALAGFDNVDYLANGQPWLGEHDVPAAEEMKEEPRRSRLGAWSRTLRLERGTVFLDFNDSGAETYFKITHSVPDDGGGYDRETLFFDRKELAAFLSAIRRIDDNRQAGKDVMQGIVVASLSGDVTFGMERHGDVQAFTITQTKAYGGNKLRINTVTLRPNELKGLVDGVEAALAEWKG